MKCECEEKSSGSRWGRGTATASEVWRSNSPTLRLRVRRHRRRSREQVEVKKKESKWRRTGECGPMLYGPSRRWHLANILFSTASSLRELMAASGFWPRMRGSNWRDLAGEHFPPIRGRRWREDGLSWPCLTAASAVDAPMCGGVSQTGRVLLLWRNGRSCSTMRGRSRGMAS